jgi:hypothetical protein
MQGHKSLSNEDFFRIAAQGLEGLSAAQRASFTATSPKTS